MTMLMGRCLLFSLCSIAIFSCSTKEYPEEDYKPLVKKEERQKSRQNVQESKDDIPEKFPLGLSSKSELTFAKGVSLEKGWYDVDKLKRPEDIMICWLITASNMVQWWQDRYTESGAILPSGTPNGIGSSPYKLAVFDEAIKSFTSLNFGGDISNGLSWYIRGIYPRIRGYAQPRRHALGGYLRSIPETAINYPERFFLDFDAWSHLVESKDVLKLFSDRVIQRLERGAVLGMDVKTHVGLGGGLHAVSVWGVEKNSSGQVQAIDITDSDDFETRLVRCSIEVVKNPSFPGWVLAMDIPVSAAYTAGAKWEILRLTYLAYSAL